MWTIIYGNGIWYHIRTHDIVTVLSYRIWYHIWAIIYGNRIWYHIRTHSWIPLGNRIWCTVYDRYRMWFTVYDNSVYDWLYMIYHIWMRVYDHMHEPYMSIRIWAHIWIGSILIYGSTFVMISILMTLFSLLLT